MRFLTAIAGLALFACGRPPGNGTPTPPDPPPTDAGAAAVTPASAPTPTPAETFLGATQGPHRAWVKSCGNAAARLSELDDAESRCTGQRGKIEELVAIEETPAAVRVVDNYASIRHAMYVRRADLDERLVDATPLRSAPDKVTATAPSAVRVMGGASIAVTERRGAWIRTTISDEGVEATGWLEKSRLGRVYTAAKPETFGSTLSLNSDLEVRASAGGPVVATVKRGLFRRHIRAARTLGDETEVEIATRWLRVRGLVKTSDVTRQQQGTWGTGASSGGWGASDTYFLSVPKNTTLHADPHGAVVAITTEDNATIALRRERDDEWVAVRFSTRWHMVNAWVRCPSYGRAKGLGADIHCVPADDPAGLEELPGRW